jgi:photosystem II stability/assembly factor-like uncharacterized protein
MGCNAPGHISLLLYIASKHARRDRRATTKVESGTMTTRFVLSVVAVLFLAGCGGSGASAGLSNAPAKAQNHLHSIVIVPGKPNDVYFGGHYSLYKSTDGGKKWGRLTNQMMLSLALNQRNPSTLWAVSLQRGVVVSTDGGTAWKHPATPVPKGSATGVMYDAASSTVYAYGAGIYRSTDAGARWVRSRKGDTVTSMAVGAGGTIFAATGNGLFISRDGGVHWTASKAIGNQPVIQVVASTDTAYAVTAIGLMKSSNNGLSWTTLNRAPQGIEFIGGAPSDPRYLVAEVSQSGFYASRDGGNTWHKTTGIHARKFNGSTVQLASTDPRVGYTGSWGLNVYVTHDGGLHWTNTATLKS